MDFQNAFGPGASYLSYMTELNGPELSVFVGEASGVAQSWDFTSYTYNYAGKSLGIVPSTAPLSSEFPSANIVLYEKTWVLGPDTIFSWNYKLLESDKLSLLGISDDTSVLMKYDPVYIHSLVPMSFGQSWIRQRDSTSVSPDFYIITQVDGTVDAFGTMKVPAGEYQCLRLTMTNMSITHSPLSVDTSYSRSFNFYAKGMTEVNIMGIQQDQFNLSTVNVSGIKISQHEGESGIPQPIPSSNQVILEQNFPNPVTSQTTIRYWVPVTNYVSLKIFDFIGNEITTLVKEKQSPGTHEIIFNASGLANGIYTCQLISGAYSSTKKMVICK